MLNARRTDEEYRGSYETNVLRRFQQFANSPTVLEESLLLFTLIALNCAIRNGDAHLKNFGIVYDTADGEAHLAPVYDLVTTTVYLPGDQMALTLNGTTRWPSAKNLIRFGEQRSQGARKALSEILERIADALADTQKEVEANALEHPDFAPIGGAMLEQWKLGRED